MLYQILLAVGGLGLLTQAVLGFAHSDGDSDGSHPAHNMQDQHGQHGDGHTWLLMFSPLRLFGFSLGIGAAGMGLQSTTTLSPWLVLALSLLAGLAFYRLIVKPLMDLAMRFASKPATTLSGAVGQEVMSDSRFDATGKGIVTLTVDGHLIRLLATLEGAPEPIEAGEKLVVIAIDTRRNTAKVAKL
ncbi:hypothetical protein [Armatimonas sp.]|uniref:hypothetical protein n=1 Tax=Armatimonas sp. TaxID=1872638 RepID=UPI00286A4466|nr:hypothetical protein [Armatimonas sp.]